MKERYDLLVEQLIEGNYYEFRRGAIMYWTPNSQYMSIIYNSRGDYNKEYRKSAWRNTERDFRVASPKNIRWLKACIDANKFIPEDELIDKNSLRYAIC